MHRRIKYLVVCAAFLWLLLWAPAAVLYSTDFSSFPVGDDQLVGDDGRNGNSIGEHVHGIGANLVSGLGNSAWIGYDVPRTNLVKVFHGLAPTTSALPAK